MPVKKELEDLRQRIIKLEASEVELGKVKEALQDSETRFRLLFEKAIDPILLLEDNRYADCNNAALTILHCSTKEQVVGLRPSQISPEKQPDGQLSAEKEKIFSTFTETGDGSHFEWVHRNFDGKDFWVDISLNRIPISGKFITYVLWRDATERKESERILREAEEKYRSIFENAVEGIFQSTPDGRFQSVNPALAGMCGYSSPEEMIASITDMSRQHYVVPEQRELFMKILNEQGFVENFEHQAYRKDGNVIWISINARTVRDEHGKILYYEGTHENITERKRSEEKLLESEQRLSDIIQFLPDPTMVIDNEGKVTAWNLAMEKLTGVKAENMLGKGDYEYALPFYGERRPALIDLVKEPADEIEKRYTIIKRRGGILEGEGYTSNLRGKKTYLYATATVLRNSKGKPVGAIESIRNITERKQTEIKLAESEERYRTAIEHSNDGVVIVKGDKYVYVNQKFLEMFGYDNPDDIIGNSISKVVHPEDREAVEQYNRERHQGKLVRSRYEFKGIRKDGAVIFIEASVASIVYYGEPASLAYLRDITKRRQMEEQLHTMSIVDELTGLYNRRGFFTLSQQQLKIAERTKKDMVLFFSDLDHMKLINDTLGHQEGDKALIEVAAILRQTFRETDIIGRMGGDEFAILAIDATGKTVETLMKRLHDSLDSYNKLENRRYKLILSVGIAHSDPENPTSLDELIAQADALMYEEKKRKQKVG